MLNLHPPGGIFCRDIIKQVTTAHNIVAARYRATTIPVIAYLSPARSTGAGSSSYRMTADGMTDNATQLTSRPGITEGTERGQDFGDDSTSTEPEPTTHPSIS